MNDPDAVTMLIWLGGLVVLGLIGMWMEHRLKKRNRWTAAPKPDSRSSIEQFKRIHRP